MRRVRIARTAHGDAPADAELVAGPRTFTEDGRVDGLQQELPSPTHPSGQPWLPEPITTSCHDITTYVEAGLAAGACEGNGILLDISDPAAGAGGGRIRPQLRLLALGDLQR